MENLDPDPLSPATYDGLAANISLDFAAEAWSSLGRKSLRKEAARVVATVIDLLRIQRLTKKYELNIVLTDDPQIQALNLQHRSKDQPTNVLSFPYITFTRPLGLSTYLESQNPAVAAPTNYPPLIDLTGQFEAGHGILGDVVMSYTTAQREAEEQDVAFIQHFSFLLVHALLHLLGYDHCSDTDATLMEELEAAIMEKLGYGDAAANIELENPAKLKLL